jgi:two-component sensor histidine kinase
MRPRYALGLLLILGLLGVLRVFAGDVPAALELRHLATGFGLILVVLVLAPAPWQWTGDARRKAPFPRGLAQALAWNGAWLGLLLFLLALARPHREVLFDPAAHTLRATVARSFQDRPLLQRTLVPMVGLLPLVMAAGWFMALLQAAEGDRAEAVAGRRAMELAAREAQEQALKAQLDPHVLYNALGGIAELVREDPDRAEAAVLSLAELYRQLTALGRRAEVTLEEERALVADYLALEQLRLGDRLKVAWDWPAALGPRLVPPLLLQPLVENAVKHGLAPRREGGTLALAVAPDGPGLRFRVADDGVPLAPAWRPGTGLANLGQRLALLGGGSRLELRGEGAWTVAELYLAPAPLQGSFQAQATGGGHDR